MCGRFVEMLNEISLGIKRIFNIGCLLNTDVYYFCILHARSSRQIRGKAECGGSIHATQIEHPKQSLALEF